MPVSFMGYYPERKRLITGLMSFDIAVSGNLDRNEFGMPLRCGYHIYSTKTGIGKTTCALSLAGIVSGLLKGNIAILPIDTFDIEMAKEIITKSGADGKCEFIFEEKPIDQVEKLRKLYLEKDTCVSVLDSINAVMSTVVWESKPGDGNMGRDALFLSNHIKHMKRDTVAAKEDKIFIMTNVGFVNMGFVGTHTKGGDAPRSQTSIHIRLEIGKIGNKYIQYPVGRLVTGKVEKNNWGIGGQEFRFFVLGGMGIHKGLTAVFDCLSYGYADVDGRNVSLNGEKLSSVKEMLADYNNDELFMPFIKQLADAKDDIVKGVKVKKSKKSDEDDVLPEDEL